MFKVILLVSFVNLVFSVRSGLYIDNGFDQTIIHHELSVDEKQEMETGLLNILGLPHRPPKNKLTSNQTNLRRSSTRFLMQIYKSLMDKENSGGRVPRDLPDMILSQQQLNVIDAIMTFESHGTLFCLLVV